MLFTVHLLFNTLLSQKKSMFVVKPAAFFRYSNAHVPSRHLQQHVTNHTPLKNPTSAYLKSFKTLHLIGMQIHVLLLQKTDSKLIG